MSNDGTVDGNELAAFGQTNFNSPFDFDANGTVDAADYAAIGARFWFNALTLPRPSLQSQGGEE